MNRPNDSMIRVHNDTWVNRFKVTHIKWSAGFVDVHLQDGATIGCGCTAEGLSRLLGKIRHGEDELGADPLVGKLLARITELEAQVAQ